MAHPPTHKVHAIELANERDNVLRQKHQFVGSWTEFVVWLGRHTIGFKSGRAVVPYLGDWSEGSEQPRKEAHKRPGVRTSMLVLDLDEETEDSLDEAHARLERAGVSYLSHSSHSHDPEADVHKMRLYVPIAAELKEPMVAPARMQLAAWLGLRTDTSTTGLHTLFYTPRAPAETHPQAVFLCQHRRLLTLDELPELLIGSEEEQVPAVFEVVARRDDWPEAVRMAAHEWLQHTARRIRQHRSVHLREDLKRSATLVGGYVASGLLDRDEVLELLEQAVYDRADAFPGDDHTPESRAAQVEEMLGWGETRPILPKGFTASGHLAEDVAPAQLWGSTWTTDRLKKHRPQMIRTLADARVAMHNFLRLERGLTPWVGLVEVSVGSGKTFELRQLAAERASRGDHTLILSLDHALLGQIRRDLEASGTSVYHLHSVTAPKEKTGGEECRRRLDVDVVQMVGAGANVMASVCKKCPFRSGCRALAYKRRALKEFVVVAPYEMAEHALDMIAERKTGGGTLLVCDEEPPGPQPVIVHQDELDRLQSSHVWTMLRADQTSNVTGLMHCVINDADPPTELLEAVRGYYGQLHLDGYSAIEMREYRQDFDAIKRVMSFASGWTSRYFDKAIAAWRADVPARAWKVLASEGGYVLTATPNRALYESSGVTVDELVLRVQDHVEAHREVVYTPHSSRSRVMPDHNIDWSLVAADLELVWSVAPAPQRVLIGTYKAIADALRTTHRFLVPAGRVVDLIHYEVVRGRDDWREFDAFVSLYDPRPPPMHRRSGKPDWDGSADAASRTLEQFHGRSRDPQPRAHPARHFHFGQVPPVSWWKDGPQGNTLLTIPAYVTTSTRPVKPTETNVTRQSDPA